MRGQFALLPVVLILFATSAFGDESKGRFGTCSFWQERRPGPVPKPEDEWGEMYRIGVAHGFALGVGAHISGRAGSRAANDPRWEQLVQLYANGYAQVLMRPAILMDAFDSKCADYRNVALELTDVGFLVILEIGGIKPDRIEEAIVILRAKGWQSEVLSALLK
jgi:hypothetical protein